MRQRYALRAFLFGVAALWSVDAAADSILYSQIQVFAQSQDVIGFPSDSDSSTVQNTDTLGPLSAQVGSTSSTASIVDGVLGAGAWATSSATGIQGQTSFAQTIFVDTLTIFSNTLALGTPVTLQFALGLDGTTTEQWISGVQVACGTLNAVGSVYVTGGTQTVASAQDSSCLGSLDFNFFSIFDVKVGDELTVQLQLLASASARAGASAYADATHTLNWFIDPLGDFGYTTLSGNSYTTATPPPSAPEPASLLLFGIAGAGIVAKMRRRKDLTPTA
jgi:hypothetical protein